MIRKAFRSRYLSGEKIEGIEIKDFLKENLFLGRTVEKIRSFLQHDTRDSKRECSKRKRDVTPVKRNTIPNCIYNYFSDHIEKRIAPSVAEILAVYSNSPTFQRYSTNQIQDLVQKAIEYEI